jgi:hypothetical protein
MNFNLTNYYLVEKIPALSNCHSGNKRWLGLPIIVRSSTMSSATTLPSLNLSVNLNDLNSASQLNTFLQSVGKPIFNFGSQVTPYLSKPIQAVPDGIAATIVVSGGAIGQLGRWDLDYPAAPIAA